MAASCWNIIPNFFSFRLGCRAEDETQVADDDALTENEENLGKTTRNGRSGSPQL